MAMHKPQGKGEKCRKALRSTLFSGSLLGKTSQQAVTLQVICSRYAGYSFSVLKGYSQQSQTEIATGSCSETNAGTMIEVSQQPAIPRASVLSLHAHWRRPFFAGQPDLGGHVTCLTIPPVLPWNVRTFRLENVAFRTA
jgi:hypothetical protein